MFENRQCASCSCSLSLIIYVSESGGFGFTITSRETGKGERLFYIGTVKADGAAVDKLRAGDRLLEVYKLFINHFPSHAREAGFVLLHFVYYCVLRSTFSFLLSFQILPAKASFILTKFQLNDEKTVELSQNDMVERLKRLSVGDSVKLLVSRLGTPEHESQNSATAGDVLEGCENSCQETAGEQAGHCRFA